MDFDRLTRKSQEGIQRAGKIAEAEEAGAQARMLDWKRQLSEGGGE